MESLAVVFPAPERIELRTVELAPVTAGQVVVAVEWSGISTGTERLLFTGAMPPFPGLGYPLVPGYESVGRVIEVAGESTLRVGDRVFVPGSTGFTSVRGLFGGAASHLTVNATRAIRLDEGLEQTGVLLALAATARHALAGGAVLPELIVGHGVLGRLLARLVVAAGGAPVVWEKHPARLDGAQGYPVVDPATDTRRGYRCIVDVSGDASLVDTLVGRLARAGELVLAGFYSEPVRFAFPPAFMVEARLRVAAEWQPADLEAVLGLVQDGRLSLDGLITHTRPAAQAGAAYATAFGDPSCLKMLLDWRASG